MALKVSGSIPGIYPILLKTNWHIMGKKVIINNYLNFKITSFLNQSFIYSNSFLLKLFLIKNIFLFTKKYTFLYKNFFKLKSKNFKFTVTKPNFDFTKNNLHFFVKLTSLTVNKKLSIHHSYTSYYYQSSRNMGIINVFKVFNLWKNMINFLINIFYFDIKYLVFSTNYFKYETLSLN